MQQNERLALAKLDVVQADTIDLEETSPRWIATLGGIRHPSVHQGRDGERRYADHRRGRVGVICEMRQLLPGARPRRREATLRTQ
jgi:hypothetical protein